MPVLSGSTDTYLSASYIKLRPQLLHFPMLLSVPLPPSFAAPLTPCMSSNGHLCSIENQMNGETAVIPANYVLSRGHMQYARFSQRGYFIYAYDCSIIQQRCNVPGNACVTWQPLLLQNSDHLIVIDTYHPQMACNNKTSVA